MYQNKPKCTRYPKLCQNIVNESIHAYLHERYEACHNIPNYEKYTKISKNYTKMHEAEAKHQKCMKMSKTTWKSRIIHVLYQNMLKMHQSVRNIVECLNLPKC